MSYREIIAVCSEIHTKHTNILRGQNVELANVKLYNPYPLKGEQSNLVLFCVQNISHIEPHITPSRERACCSHRNRERRAT